MNKTAEATAYEVQWAPIDELGRLVLPPGAQVVHLMFAGGFGYGAGQIPVGVWFIAPIAPALPPPG